MMEGDGKSEGKSEDRQCSNITEADVDIDMGGSQSKSQSEGNSAIKKQHDDGSIPTPGDGPTNISANVNAQTERVEDVMDVTGNEEEVGNDEDEDGSSGEIEANQFNDSEVPDGNALDLGQDLAQETPAASASPAMTTRSGRPFGRSIRKTLFKSAGLHRRSLTMSAAKRRNITPVLSRKRKISGSPQNPNKKKITLNTDDLFDNIKKMIIESEARQTKTIMTALEKKQEEGLKELKKATAALKKEQKDFFKDQREKLSKIEEDQKNIKESSSQNDKSIKKMEKELKQLNSKLQTNKGELEKSLETKKKYIQAEIVDTKDILKKAQESAKECRKNIHERIDQCVGRVSTLEDNVQELVELRDGDGDGTPLAAVEFPVKCTAVAKFVKQPAGVSPTKIAQMLIHEALELSDKKIVQVKSMSRNPRDGKGTLKIQLETPSDLADVLDAKYKLSEFDGNRDIQDVRMRQSKSHEQLVAEQNSDAMLKAMDLYGDFYRTDKGYLLPKNQQRRQTSQTETGRGGHRGRGGGRGGRGGRGFNRNMPNSNRGRGRTQATDAGDGGDEDNYARPPRRQLSDSARRLLQNKPKPRDENASDNDSVA